MDHASALLSQLGVQAGSFHSGSFCGVSAIDGAQPHGHIHLLRAGRIRVLLGVEGVEREIEEPALIFIPGPYRHRVMAAPEDGAELVCATLRIGGGNPLAAALPPYLILPLSEAPALGGTLEWLFREAFGDEYGRGAVTDRLFELLVIQLLRHLLRHEGVAQGVLAGLADARLARALHLIHTQPQRDISVEELAAEAAMSRAGFAAHFKTVVGDTPADYLASWRINLAQKLLREGQPMSLVAAQVGYESPSALARMFRRKTGASPREWLALQKRGVP